MPRQVVGLLLGRALGDEGRAGVHLADEADADLGGLRRRLLLEVDEVLAGAGALAAALDRPVDAGVAGLEQQALPVGLVGAAPGPVVLVGLGRKGGDDLGEPRAQLGAERGFFLGVAQVHWGLLVLEVGPALVAVGTGGLATDLHR